MTDQSSPSTKTAKRNFLIVTAVYAAIMFTVCFVLAIAEDDASWLLIPAVAVAMATLEVSAMWAVLGPGSFFHRASRSFALAAIVGSSGLLGSLNLFVTDLDFDSILVIVVAFVGMLPFAWLVTQMPFWFMRILFGWYLAPWPGPVRRAPMTIRDLLGITAMFAIVLAGLRMSVLTNVNNVRDADPTVGLAFAFFPATFYSFLVFLMFILPCILLVLRTEPIVKGYQWYGGVSIVFIMGIIGLITATMDAPVGVPELGGLVGFLSMFFLAIGVPLVVIRRSGFMLYTRGRNRKWFGDERAWRAQGKATLDTARRGAERAPADPLGIEDEPPASATDDRPSLD